MREAVVELLTAFGVPAAGEDPLLDTAVINTTWRVKNLANLSAIPEGLMGMAVQMAAGEYLRMKKGVGQLASFDLDVAVKQVQEGDTSTTFAIGEGSMTPEQRLDRLIEHLTSGHIGEIYRYRRFAW